MIEGSCHCGAVRWTFAPEPEAATVCNCTVCRRYGALWIYDYDAEGITVTAAPGAVRSYVRGDAQLTFNFCTTCGCITHWRGIEADAQGRVRCAVNVRMAEPSTVADIPIDRFDGLESWADLPPDGRCVAQMMF